MKKFALAATAILLVSTPAHAQLLGGGGGLGGSLGGSLGGVVTGPVGSSIDSTTRRVRSSVDNTVGGSVATDGDQSVDARGGSVSANRSANGSLTGSTASLADLAIPAVGGTTGASASGQASGQGNANAQLIGTDAVAGTAAPLTGRARSLAGGAASHAGSTASGALASAPTPGLPAFGNAGASGEGSAQGNGSASLLGAPLAVAGSAASAGQGAATVAPGMPVMTPQGASLGTFEQIFANGRGEVQQVVVSQGNVTRTLPAQMFSATGSALIAGNAAGEGSAGSAPERPQPEGAEAN